MNQKVIKISKQEAQQFLMIKHGFVGEKKLIGKEGILSFIQQVGCIQYDPIDVCGKNAELVLQSRVLDFQKEWLHDLLYKEYKLLDYWDKNMSITLIEDWPLFHQTRLRFQGENPELATRYLPNIKQKLKNFEFISSKDFESDSVDDSLDIKRSQARNTLEDLFHQGFLTIHHRKNTHRYFTLAQNTIPENILFKQHGFKEEAILAHRLKRRIGAIGMLWDRASDGLLGLGIKSNQRKQGFQTLLNQHEIIGLEVEGIEDLFYILKEDESLLKSMDLSQKSRCELIAPLDSFLWDRKLIEKIFGFSYTWEIYTPASKRQFGYYTLPIICDSTFIGRMEIVHHKKKQCLEIKHLWLESNNTIDGRLNRLLQDMISRFAHFHQCEKVYSCVDSLQM